MTVSRVVNGGQLVNAATATRVRAAIKKLGYQPNEAARMLKGQSSKTIGLIVPDLADTFFSICAHAVQQMAAKQGYLTLLLASERDRDSEAKELAMMMSRNIAGILIVPSSPDSIGQLQDARSRGVPVVMLDRTFPGLDAGKLVKRLRSPNPPTALFTLNNVTTIDVLQTLQRESIQVPQKVAIIGFDDFELATLLTVPLTAVRQPAAELGRTAAHLLLDWIRSRNPEKHPEHPQIVLPTELIIRRSCGCEIIRRNRA
jgi:DNA-binding LacI/PurR family transcriptional regulator